MNGLIINSLIMTTA
ncbi:hypothetical protein YPPY92_3024, partial [Yersinia pestis PY-92]